MFNDCRRIPVLMMRLSSPRPIKRRPTGALGRRDPHLCGNSRLLALALHGKHVARVTGPMRRGADITVILKQLMLVVVIGWCSPTLEAQSSQPYMIDNGSGPVDSGALYQLGSYIGIGTNNPLWGWIFTELS